MKTEKTVLELKWIGQSGYIINDGETEICIDPYLSDIVNRLQKRPRMVKAPFAPEELKSDIVICTHDHLDHLDIDAIPLMKKENMLFLAPSAAEEKLRECGVINYESFDEGKVFKAGGFELEAVFAEHSAPAVGVIVRYNGITMYFSGDTLYNKKLEELRKYNVDIMFICVNGKLGNMNADEAVKLTGIIKPRIAVPAHYGMFESNTIDPKEFTSKIDCGFELEYDKEYNIYEILKGCKN